MSMPEVNTFWPLIKKPPSVAVARVVSEAASEPEFGSVRPRQNAASPRSTLGSSVRLLLRRAVLHDARSRRR